MITDKYSGEWTSKQAAHLLRRTIYGPTLEQIDQVVNLGMDATLDLLLTDLPQPDPPINMEYEEDPNVPIGETWIHAPSLPVFADNNYRRRSIRAWMIDLGREKNLNIREKMVLFWHNHFVVANINDARFLYQYINTIRNKATGNFRELTKEMTIDPAMLIYLNGNQNTKDAPNENYARELLELFTVGKGELAGPGDYSTFTEDDVISMAKVLTGWVIRGFNSIEIGEIYSEFRRFSHDKLTKQLSHRFNNVVLNNEDENEYKTLIDIIFESDAVALYISRKLFRWLVYYDISAQVEEEVILPMAQLLRESDYEIKPVIRLLLESEYFYQDDHVGCMIKHPLEFLFSIFNQFNINFPNNPLGAYRLSLGFFQFSGTLQMEIFGHPSVAGWKPFYQAPSYYQLWINSTTLPLRKLLVDTLTFEGIEIDRRFGRVTVDILSIVDNLDNPFDINDLLSELSKLMFPKPLTDIQIKSLKEILIPGLPDFEWTVEYAAYRDDPENEEIKTTITNKLLVLINAMLNLPEYHLI